MFISAFRKLVSFSIFWLATKHFFATEYAEVTEANFSLHRSKNQVGLVYFGRPVLDVNICERHAYSPLVCRGSGKAFSEADQMSHSFEQESCTERRVCRPGLRYWFRFGRVWRVVHFRNPLLKLSLCSFLPFENWFRFTFFSSWFIVLCSELSVEH